MVRSIMDFGRVKDPAEIESYEGVVVDGQSRWMKVRGSLEGFTDLFRQSFGGSTSKAEYYAQPSYGPTGLEGEFRLMAYTSSWKWGAAPNYNDKYDLKAYYWLPPGVEYNKDIARDIAQSAFDSIPELSGARVSNAQDGQWSGYKDDVIFVSAVQGKPIDFRIVTAEYTHTKKGNVTVQWGPYAVGSNPYI